VHLDGDAGVARLVGADERHAAQPEEEERRGQGQQQGQRPGRQHRGIGTLGLAVLVW
jgi:hypothetical protein